MKRTTVLLCLISVARLQEGGFALAWTPRHVNYLVTKMIGDSGRLRPDIVSGRSWRNWFWFALEVDDSDAGGDVGLEVGAANKALIAVLFSFYQTRIDLFGRLVSERADKANDIFDLFRRQLVLERRHLVVLSVLNDFYEIWCR